VEGPMQNFWSYLCTCMAISGQSNLTKRLHHRRMWSVQSYSFVFARLRQCASPSNNDLLGPPESTNQTTSGLVQLFCTAHGRLSLYFTMGYPFPLKIAPSHGGSGPHPMHGSLGPSESTSHAAAHRSIHLLLHGSRSWQTDRQTTLLGQ